MTSSLATIVVTGLTVVGSGAAVLVLLDSLVGTGRLFSRWRRKGKR